MKEVIYREVQRHLRYVRMSGPNNLGGPCPFHKGGEEKRPSFYINLETGLYFCHTCKAKGTFEQFLKKMGAPTIQIDMLMEEADKKGPSLPKPDPYRNSGHGEHFLNESILGCFQFCPTDLVRDGFDEGLLRRLEIGFDREEMRIIFPIRDLKGRLVGLSGRSVSGDREKYRVYKAKDILRFAPDDPVVRAKYEKYDIKNHNFLWNGHNVYQAAFDGDIDTVVVVEGYKACIWLIQNDIENVVALQGSKMSQPQERILHRMGASVILFLDNNKAGREGTFDTGRRLRKLGIRVLCVDYPADAEEAAQPDNLDQPALIGVLDAALDWHNWRSRHELFGRK
jgi:DNA primase